MRLRFFATAAVAVLAVFGVATPAFAHDQLLSSSPANGAVLASAPSEVSLSFNEAVLDLGNAIIVNDASGTNWISGGVVITSDGVSAPLKAGMPDGVYTWQWRVVSADGHPVSGTIVFGVGSGSALSSQVAAAVAALGTPAADTDDDDDAASSGGLNGWQIAGIGAAGAVLAIALFIGAWFTIRSIRRRAETRNESSQQ